MDSTKTTKTRKNIWKKLRFLITAVSSVLINVFYIFPTLSYAADTTQYVTWPDNGITMDSSTTLQAIKYYTQNKSYFKQHSIFFDLFRKLGEIVIKLLYKAADLCSKLYNDVFEILDFTGNTAGYATSNGEQVKTHEGFLAWLNQDDIKGILLAMLAVSLVIFGISLMINQTKGTQLLKNIAIFLIVFTSINFAISALNGLVKEAKVAILGEEEDTSVNADGVLAQYIHSLSGYESQLNGGLATLNPSSANTVVTIKGESVEDIDLLSIVDPEDDYYENIYSEKSQKILERYAENVGTSSKADGTLTNAVSDSDTVGEAHLNALKFGYVYNGNIYQLKSSYSDLKKINLLNNRYYTYSVDWIPLILQMLSLIILYIAIAFKTLKLIVEIIAGEITSLIYSTQIHDGEKGITAIKSVLGCYMSLVFSMLLIKIWQLASIYINSMSFGNLEKSIIMLFLVFILMDGPNIMQKVTGQDAGMRGLVPMMLARGIARGAARVATAPLRAGKSFAMGAAFGKGGNSIAGSLGEKINPKNVKKNRVDNDKLDRAYADATTKDPITGKTKNQKDAEMARAKTNNDYDNFKNGTTQAKWDKERADAQNIKDRMDSGKYADDLKTQDYLKDQQNANRADGTLDKLNQANKYNASKSAERIMNGTADKENAVRDYNTGRAYDDIESGRADRNKEVADAKSDMAYRDLNDGTMDKEHEVASARANQAFDDLESGRMEQAHEVQNARTDQAYDDLTSGRMDEAHEVQNARTDQAYDDLTSGRMEQAHEVQNARADQAYDDYASGRMDEAHEVQNARTDQAYEDLTSGRMDEAHEVQNARADQAYSDLESGRLDQAHAVQAARTEQSYDDLESGRMAKAHEVQNARADQSYSDLQSGHMGQAHAVQNARTEQSYDDLTSGRMKQAHSVQAARTEQSYSDLQSGHMDQAHAVQNARTEQSYDDLTSGHMDQAHAVQNARTEQAYDDLTSGRMEQAHEVQNARADQSYSDLQSGYMDQAHAVQNSRTEQAYDDLNSGRSERAHAVQNARTDADYADVKSGTFNQNREISRDNTEAKYRDLKTAYTDRERAVRHHEIEEKYQNLKATDPSFDEIPERRTRKYNPQYINSLPPEEHKKVIEEIRKSKKK